MSKTTPTPSPAPVSPACCVPFDQIPIEVWRVIAWLHCTPGVAKPDLYHVRAACGLHLVGITVMDYFRADSRHQEESKNPRSVWRQMGGTFVTNFGCAAVLWAQRNLRLPLIDFEQRLPPNEARVPEHEIPAAMRQLGEPNGDPLTAPYLEVTPGWKIPPEELAKAHTRGDLTYRLKLAPGHSYVYLYEEVRQLRDKLRERPKRRRSPRKLS